MNLQRTISTPTPTQGRMSTFQYHSPDPRLVNTRTSSEGSSICIWVEVSDQVSRAKQWPSAEEVTPTQGRVSMADIEEATSGLKRLVL